MIKTVNGTPIIPSLKGAAIAIGVSAAAILISGIFLTESKSLDMLVGVLPKIIQIVSSLIGGFAAAKLSKERSLLTSLISGLFYGVFIIIGSLISGGFELYYAVISLLSVTVASVIGSFFAKDRPKSGSARRRSMMKMMGK